MAEKLQFIQLQTQNTQLTLLSPKKKNVFWMKFMITKKSSGPESGRNDERKVIRRHQEFGHLQARRKLVQSITIHKKIHNYEWEKWKVIHVHWRDGGDLAVSVSKMIATMLRHFDQEERQLDGSRHCSDPFRDTLVVFQSPTWWNKHLFHTIGKSTFTTEEVRAFFSLFWLVCGIILGGKE